MEWSGNNKGSKGSTGWTHSIAIYFTFRFSAFSSDDIKKIYNGPHIHVDLLGHQLRTIYSEKYQEFIAMYAYKTSIFLLRDWNYSAKKNQNCLIVKHAERSWFLCSIIGSCFDSKMKVKSCSLSGNWFTFVNTFANSCLDHLIQFSD